MGKPRRPDENWFKHRLRLLASRKSLDQILREGNASTMKRSLTAWDLTMIGVGAIIGGGIFVLTGVAAAKYAGPAIIVSFIIAGVCAGIAAFSYSELASMVPISGSAYTYTYATMGELLAWIIGWDLILEYLVGAATVAVSWSSYLVALFKDAFGVTLDPRTTSGPVIWDGSTFVRTGNIINIPAILIVLLITVVLVVGIQESARLNMAAVLIKVLVVLIFIFAACGRVDPANYKPFVPPAQDGKYGGLGIIRGAKTVFFAYIGFDAVSTAAQEAKNPKRDLPIGIISSLIICTTLYIATAAVVVGLRPYYELDVAHPISFALENMSNTRWLRILVDIGAVAGLLSVMLILMMGQPRIFHTMAKDGMLPSLLARIHPRFRTPYIPTIITGVCCAVLAGFLPVDLLGDMTSVGTLLAFFLVHAGVIILRFTNPDMPRGFRVPLGPFVLPVLGGAISIALIVLSEPTTIYRLFAWLGIGLIVYAIYGHRKSHLNFPRENEEVEPDYGYTATGHA
ncbi:cationic amino acid transporter [Dimargaris cristalligena]|uniref:Cationic amino acid transporter n=1 Tax=Dimargaris cristalligena TaxID=215637 RepID=A0A4P9ZM71_9FUNG|nr:cationic amino acid transporter [Dimargaris cristalligena]|eukprot:RKP34273.1 cationic amino acid transporter [Dimargaris cristalligena]